MSLKNLYIAYNLPSENLKKHLGIEKCKIYFNAANLWTWAKNGLFDPENVVTNANPENLLDKHSYVGETSYAIPATKTFMCGLQLDF